MVTIVRGGDGGLAAGKETTLVVTVAGVEREGEERRGRTDTTAGGYVPTRGKVCVCRNVHVGMKALYAISHVSLLDVGPLDLL